MMDTSVKTSPLCITIIEAGFLFGLTRHRVEMAIWQDRIKARQAYGSRQWMIDFESCVRFFGQPVNNGLLEQIRMDWNE